MEEGTAGSVTWVMVGGGGDSSSQGNMSLVSGG